MILAATGLRREADILTRRGVVAVAGGGDAVRLERALEARVKGARALLSIGLGGALAEGLRPGDWVIGTYSPSASSRMRGSMIPEPQESHALENMDSRMRGNDGGGGWSKNLRTLLPRARTGPIHADGTMIATAAAKHALHAATGAIAADMESHVAARVAARHRLPFAILRVISDAADRDLPAAVQVGMKPDGGMAPAAVLRDLLRDPRQIPALIRVAIDAERAFRSLLRGCDMLAGVGFGLADLGEFPLDMA